MFSLFSPELWIYMASLNLIRGEIISENRTGQYNTSSVLCHKQQQYHYFAYIYRSECRTYTDTRSSSTRRTIITAETRLIQYSNRVMLEGYPAPGLIHYGCFVGITDIRYFISGYLENTDSQDHWNCTSGRVQPVQVFHSRTNGRGCCWLYLPVVKLRRH